MAINNLWKEHDGKGFAAIHSEYAVRASKDEDGNEITTTYATKSEMPDISGKQDTVTFADGYDATTNPAATVATVTNAVSSLVSCDVSYNSSTGELHLDFSTQVNNGGN